MSETHGFHTWPHGCETIRTMEGYHLSTPMHHRQHFTDSYVAELQELLRNNTRGAGEATCGAQENLYVPRAAHSEAWSPRAVHEHQGVPPGPRLLLWQPLACAEVRGFPSGAFRMRNPSSGPLVLAVCCVRVCPIGDLAALPHFLEL